MSNVNVIIAAGGASQRYGAENKLFEPCGESCVLIEAIKPFLAFDEVKRVIVAIDPSYSDELLNGLSALHLDEDKRIILTQGGSTRTKTVRGGLNSLEEDCDIVVIHDGARPFVSEELISKVIAGAKECGASLPLLPPTDALVSVKDGVFSADRADFRLVQTPAAFDKTRVLDAYLNSDGEFYDDISVVQTYSKGEVKIVDGDRKNIKITVKEDLKTPLVGCGYDIHRITEGDGVKLMGTPIKCDYSFVAHSDGDVPIHALMDAILTALGEPDIGRLFPVDDKRYDNADSIDLLKKVLDIMRSKGRKLINISVCVIAEKPMLAPYIPQMRANMSKVLGIPGSRIGISATTNEQVGDIGDGNAVAAYASVLIL